MMRCLGVALAFQRFSLWTSPDFIPARHDLFLVLRDCGNSDVDNDMICDSEDECIDRQALNYADPANTPCQY